MASSRKTATNENISTYGNGTRDYTALATWEAATDIDLVSASQSEVLECYDDSASFDDWASLNGATCNVSYFRIVRPASGEGHDGTPNNGVTFISTADAGICGAYLESFTQIQDLIGKLNINSATTRSCFYANGDNSACIGCIIFDSVNSGAGSIRGVSASPTGANSFLIDCLVHNCTGNGFVFGGNISNIVYNCTSTNNVYGFYNLDDDTPVIVKNCCSSGNSTADWGNGGGGWTKTTCTAEGANPTYRNAGGDDFHLAAGDAVCRGNGTDLSTDGSYAFDDDIDEEIRVAWDIGFDEYSWAGIINGISSANIAKINGVSIANIAKVNGV